VLLEMVLLRIDSQVSVTRFSTETWITARKVWWIRDTRKHTAWSAHTIRLGLEIGVQSEAWRNRVPRTTH